MGGKNAPNSQAESALMRIDANDARILNLVQRNNRLSTNEIGDEIGV